MFVVRKEFARVAETSGRALSDAKNTPRAKCGPARHRNSRELSRQVLFHSCIFIFLGWDNVFTSFTAPAFNQNLASHCHQAILALYIKFGKVANICCVVNNLGNESWSSFVGNFYIFHIIDRPISYISTRCVYVCGIYSFLHMCWFPATNYMLCYNGRLYFSAKTTLCLILLNGFLVVDFT